MISAKYFLKLCNLLAQQRTESCCKKRLFFDKKILMHWWRAYIIPAVSLEVCLFFFWQNFPGSSVRNLLKVRCKAICFFFYNGRGSAYWFWCSLMAKKSFWKIKQIQSLNFDLSGLCYSFLKKRGSGNSFSKLQSAQPFQRTRSSSDQSKISFAL